MPDLFNTPMDEKAILHPSYFEDAECLKQVRIYESSHYYQLANNQFKHCRTKWFYCKLIIWRDDEWMLYFARTHAWPLDQKPFPEQLKQGYRASKNSNSHLFDLTDGRPCYEHKKVS